MVVGNDSMMFRFSKSKILYFLMISLPFLDAVNGIMSRQFGKSIGTLYHSAITVVLCFFALRCKKIKRVYVNFVVSFLMVCFMGISMAVITNNSDHIATDLFIKYICTILDLFSLLILIDNSIIATDFCDNIMRINLFILPVSMLISKVSGLGNSAYIYSDQGFLGFYSSSNELNCILLIFVYYALAKYFATNKPIYFIFIFVQCLCSVMIESKISMGMSVIALLVLFWGNTKRKGNKIKKRFILLIPLFLVAIIISRASMEDILNSFISRQNNLKMGYSNIFVYLSSGRLARIEEIFSFSFSDTNPFLLFYRLIFGNGFCNVVDKNYFEMEYLDTFIWCGVLGLILFSWLTVRIIRSSYRKQGRSIIRTLCICVIFVCAFFSGHVFCGGVAGIYVALACSNFMRYDLRNENLPIKRMSEYSHI